MLLGDLLSGKEFSHLVYVNDNVKQNGQPLMYCFVKSLLQSADFVHVILYDVGPEQFLSSFEEHLRERIFCFDCFSDPLGWNLQRNGSNSRVTLLHWNSNVAQVVKHTISNQCRSNHSSGNAAVKVGVVINSLSNLLLWKSPAEVCIFLNQLYANPVGSQKGYTVVQVVCLVHEDLHDDQKLNTINFLASSILWITENERQKNPDKNLSWCKILHKRKTGKTVKKVCGFTISDTVHQVTEYEETNWCGSYHTSHSIPAQQANEIDPTQNLSFNLKLTDEERKARANLKLPYMHHEKERNEPVTIVNSTGEGKVFYQPDEADDFDEDDPDDDLDI